MIFSQLCRRARQGQGIASAFGTPVDCGCNDSIVADYRRIPSGSRGGERAGARIGAHLRRGGRDRAPALAVGAVEGRPAARHARDRKAASRRVLADRARWQCGRHLAGAPWRPAVFLVRRDKGAGGGLLACDAHAPAGGSRMRPDHARDQGTCRQAGRAGLRGREHLALAQHLESRNREPVLRLDREAVRRSARCGAVVAGVARGGARPLAQFPFQPSRPQRRRQNLSSSRLRRSSLHLASVLRVQDGAALRLLEVLARRRRPRADLPAMVQLAERRRGQAPTATSGRGAHPTGQERIFRVSSAPAPLAPPAPKRTGPAPSFAELVQIVWDSVHSGSGRTALADNNTDYYPVPLSADTLRPGTVYADPYGHILMIVRRVAQTEDAAGIILAVDGQPDGTVARKRFWRG